MRDTPIIYPHHITLPQDLRKILNTIESHGYRAYIIGGCVRDSLLGITPKDWDIATNAHPDVVCALFMHDKNLKLIRTGSKYGTIGVCVGKTCYEITTFRSDGIYKDARHPGCVQFVADLAQDIARRDFSINALAYSECDGVLDYVNGVCDLHHRHLVCVGDPQIRFSEDALRILRAVRFRATLDFEIDSQTKDTLLGLSDLITTLPCERVRLELDKILVGAYAGKVLREFAQLFAQLFAHFANQPRESYARLSSTFLDNAQHIDRLDSLLPIRYAWILSGFDKEMGATLIENLHFSNTHKKQILALLTLLSLTPPHDDVAILKLLARFGAQCVCDALGIWTLRYGDLGTLPQRVRTLAKNACYELKTMQISGDTLKALDKNIDGKIIGKILQQLLDEVIEQKLPNMREPLINRATKIFTQLRKSHK